MMHAALLKLIWLQRRAICRRLLRGAMTVRGALMTVFLVSMFGFAVVPSLILRFASEQPNPFGAMSSLTHEMGPIALLAVCLHQVITSVGERGLYFTPSEVDFLFPGPFRRRELLIYKLLSSILSSLTIAVIFTLAFSAFLTSLAAGFVGMFLTLWFIALFGMSFALSAQVVEKQLFDRVRKVFGLIVVILIAVGIWQAIPASDSGNLLEIASAFRRSRVGTILLAPFACFTNLVTAESLIPAGLPWLGLSVAIDVLLVAIVLRLDANYLETAAATSQKLYERVQRARHGGGLVLSGSSRARWTIPRLPWFGGVGPIAWRQILKTLRTLRGFLLVVIIVMAAMGAPIYFSSVAASSHDDDSEQVTTSSRLLLPTIAIAATAYSSLLATSQLPLGFRGDLDHMDWLKSLPLPAGAIAIGQLAGILAMLTVLDAGLLCGVIAFAPTWKMLLLCAAALALPYNLTLVSVENLVFLHYPTRAMPATPGDFHFMGRMMLMLMLKGMVFLPCFAVAALSGLGAYWLSGYSWVAFTIACGLVLIVLNAGIIALTAHAFRKFDPSMDTPT